MTRLIINRDPKILGGTPVFVGTRVPVTALFDYLEAGDSLDEFLDDFPSVQREQALALLELAEHSLIGKDEAAKQLQVLDLFGTIDHEEDYDYKAQRKRG